MKWSSVKRAIKAVMTQAPSTITAKAARRLTVHTRYLVSKLWAFRKAQGSRALIESGQKGVFFIEPADKEKILKTLRKEYPEAEPVSIRAADKVLAGVYDILGARNVCLGAEINWHRDAASGRVWPMAHYSRIDPLQSEGGSDVKMPWELSRCHHFITLGKAYWYTADERYVRGWISQMNSWVRDNPVEFGVNWTCAMEAAIRIINWIWAYHFFYDSPLFDHEARAIFFRAVADHHRFIAGNLENIGWRNNHYLANLAALVYVGTLFPGSKDMRKWCDFASAELMKETERQFLPDGANYEDSLSYHRLSLEIVLSSVLLLGLNSVDMPQKAAKRLEKACEYAAAYTKPDGNAPQLGDSDDGRLHTLSEYTREHPDDHRYLLTVGAVLFKRSDLAMASAGFSEEALWLLGMGGMDMFKALSNEPSDTASESSIFADAGVCIMRNKDHYMIFDAGCGGRKGSGGHSHNDAMSFELYAHDKTFIIDPGTYAYTSDSRTRNLFRSTKYHNTVVVDDREINDIDAGSPFYLKNMAAARIAAWETSSSRDTVEAEHAGYERLRYPIKHRRTIDFDKQNGVWLIKDDLTGKGRHRFDLYFHFAPVKIAVDNKDGLAVRTHCEGANLYLRVRGQCPITLEIMEGCISPRYGITCTAPVAHYSMIADAPATFLTMLRTYPAYIENTVPGVADMALCGGGPWNTE